MLLLKSVHCLGDIVLEKCCPRVDICPRSVARARSCVRACVCVWIARRLVDVVNKTTKTMREKGSYANSEFTNVPRRCTKHTTMRANIFTIVL